MMTKVFLIGAGYVAGQAALELIARGHQVSIGKRQPSSGLPEGLPAHTSVHALDVLQPESFPKALLKADRIVYCVSSAGFTEEQYRLAYVNGLSNVLQALATQAKPRIDANLAKQRVIFVSSTSVYAQENGEQVDETSPAQATSFSAKVMLEAEARLEKFALENKGYECTAIRFSGIYGPGRTRMVREALNGPPVTRKRWNQFTNRIHRDDCARALVHLIEAKRVRPIYLASDQTPSRFGEVISWLAKQLNVPTPSLEEEGESNSVLAQGQQRNTGLQRGGHKQCRSTGLLAEGFEFQYPSFREGYGPLIASEFLDQAS